MVDLAWERERIDAFYRILREEQQVLRVFCHCSWDGKTARYHLMGRQADLRECKQGCVKKATGKSHYGGGHDAQYWELMGRVFARLEREVPCRT